MALTRPKSVTGSLTAVSNGTAFQVQGKFNARIGGTFVGTAELQRSLDGGTSYQTVSKDADGNNASYTAPADLVIEEPALVQYRWACTAFTSGTINYFLGN
jgi:hypothetical protein